MSILNRIDSKLKEDGDSKLKDKEYLYGRSLAAKVRNFGEVQRCMIKHKVIYQINIICRYQKYVSSILI